MPLRTGRNSCKWCDTLALSHQPYRIPSLPQTTASAVLGITKKRNSGAVLQLNDEEIRLRSGRALGSCGAWRRVRSAQASAMSSEPLARSAFARVRRQRTTPLLVLLEVARKKPGCAERRTFFISADIARERQSYVRFQLGVASATASAWKSPASPFAFISAG